MKVIMIDTGVAAEFEDNYALRLIEQGKAVPAGSEPVPPKPEPIDPSQYGPLIEALQTQTAGLQAELDAMKQTANENAVFADMYQSIAQAQERKLEYDESRIQEEIDHMTGLEV